MSSPSKKRRVIAFQSGHDCDVSIFKCGHCQCFFPSLQSIHGHFESCVSYVNPPSCPDQSQLDDIPNEVRSKALFPSNKRLPLLDEVSHGTSTKSKYSNVLTDISSEDISQAVNAQEKSEPQFVDTYKAEADLILEDNSQMKSILIDSSDIKTLSCKNLSYGTITESLYNSNTSQFRLEDTQDENINKTVTTLNGNQFKLEDTSDETANESLDATNTDLSQLEKSSEDIKVELIDTLNGKLNGTSEDFTANSPQTSNENNIHKGDLSVGIKTETEISEEREIPFKSLTISFIGHTHQEDISKDVKHETDISEGREIHLKSSIAPNNSQSNQEDLSKEVKTETLDISEGKVIHIKSSAISHQSQTRQKKTSGYTESEILDISETLRRKIPSKSSAISYDGQTNQGDQNGGRNSETAAVSEESRSKSKTKSDGISLIECQSDRFRSSTVTGVTAVGIDDINFSNESLGLSVISSSDGSNSGPEKINSNKPSSFSVPDDKLVMLSGNRKRKQIDEHSCQNRTFLAPTSNINTHSCVKYPKLATNICVNGDFTCEKSVVRRMNVKENAIELTRKKQEILNEKRRRHNNSHKLDVGVTQSSIMNSREKSSGDAGCLLENDEYKQLEESTVQTHDKTLCNKNISKSDVVSTDNTVESILDQRDSVCHMKCEEETGNCIASVNISSTKNEKNLVSKKKLNCSAVYNCKYITSKRNIKQSAEVTEEKDENTIQQPTESHIELCNDEKKTGKENDNTKKNQTRVLISYNENEDIDLNLECEENAEKDLSYTTSDVSNKSTNFNNRNNNQTVPVGGQLELANQNPCVQEEAANDLSYTTSDVSNKNTNFNNHTNNQTVPVGDQLELANQNTCVQEEAITDKFKYQLKRLSVNIERLDVSSILKSKTEESVNAKENKTVHQFNKSIDLEEPCQKKSLIKLNIDVHEKRKRICGCAEKHSECSIKSDQGNCNKINTLGNDDKTEGHHNNKDDCEVGMISGTCSGAFKYNNKEQNKDIFVNISEESSTLSESSESDEIFEYCDKCNVHFTTLTCYINHLILYHHPAYTRKHLTKCPFCSGSLYDSYFNSKLKSHIRFAHGLDEMKCISCEMKFDKYISLRKHAKTCGKRVPGQQSPGVETSSYIMNVQCSKCKTFHIYRPVKRPASVLNDIIKTMPDDQKVNALWKKNEKLKENTEQHFQQDNVKCKLCEKMFSHMRCALNHAIHVHMKDMWKVKSSLFRMKVFESECDTCKETHVVQFSRVKKIRKLLKRKEYSERLNTYDENALSMIRDGLLKYYSYKNIDESINSCRDNQICMECKTAVGPFVCGLNHLILTHFDRIRIDNTMKTSFFRQKSKKWKEVCKVCKTRHFFSILDTNRLKHYLDHNSDEQIDCESKSVYESKLTPTDTDFMIVKKFREILNNETLKTSYEYVKKTHVNVVEAKTKEEISYDMKYRVSKINGKFICGMCHSEYNQYSCCKSHVLTEHSGYINYRPGSEVYTCPECIAYFHTLHVLNVHLAEHHDIYKFTCVKCDKRFNKSSEYYYHTKHGNNLIQTNFNEKLSCKECGTIHNCTVQLGEEDMINSTCSENGTVFRNVQTKQTKHVDDSHASTDLTNKLEHGKDSYSDVAFDGQNFVCLKCLNKFENLTCCFTHIVMQHYQKADFICSICKKISRQKSAHLSHLKTNHGLCVYYCHHCYLGFEEIVLRDKHAEHCRNRTNKTPDNVTENICLNCNGIHVYMSECDINSSCDECELGFASIKCAKNHFYTKHFPAWIVSASKENVFKCPCGKEVLTKAELSFHMQTDHSLKEKANEQGKTIVSEKSQNNVYDSYFQDSSELKNRCVGCEHVHIVDSDTVTVRKKNETKCKICQKQFSIPACLLNHMLVTHTDTNQSRQCVGCGLYFVGTNILKRHQAQSNENSQEAELHFDKMCRRNVGLVKCAECNEIHQHLFSTEEKKLKNSKSPEEIRETRRKHEDTIKKFCKCSLCGLVVANHRELIAHRSSVHGKIKDEKGVICQVCDQKLDSNVFYSEHLKQVHCKFKFVKGEIIDDFSSNFSCVYCEAKFPFPIDVQMHLRWKHFEKPLLAMTHYRSDLEGIMIKGTSILQCPVCFKLMSAEKSLTTHITSHFKEKGNKQFVCDICGKGFRCKQGLEAHKERHSDIRKYKCHLCDKAFKTFSNLDTHSLVHKEKKEICKVCMMKFTLPHHLRAHMKRKHPDNV